MNSKIKYLLKNTTIFALGELGTKLIMFFLVPFYTYILTPEEYGVVDLIFTISTLLTPVVMFNIGEAIMRFALDKDANCEKILTIGIVVIVFGILISLFIIPIVSCFEIIANYAIFMYLYIIFSATKTIFTCYLRGKEKLKTYAFSNILNTFLIASLNIYFLAILHKGIEGYLSAYIISDVITIIFSLIVGKIYKDFRKLNFDRKLTIQMIKFSLAIIPNSLLWWVINSSDRIMVTSMVGPAENGILAVGYKIPSILVTINTILMQAWKYSAIKEKDNKENEEFTNKMFYQFVSASMLISACMIVVIKPITSILFEQQYFTSWESSIYLLLGFVFMGVSTFLGTAYYVEKNMIGNMLSALFGAVVNIILNLVFIPKMGAAGATLAACCCYFAIMIYRYFDTKKYQKIYLFRKEYIFTCFGIIIMIIGNVISNYFLLVIAFVLVCFVNIKFIQMYIKIFIGILKKLIKRNPCNYEE